jgi:uncharacterized RDD family membrane protein YckC
MGLRVVMVDGKKLFYDHAAVRNFGVAFVLPLLPIDLFIGFRLKDKRYIRYFDKFAGTTVLDLRQRESGATPNDLDQSSQTNQHGHED